jgi:hypothetical protein
MALRWRHPRLMRRPEQQGPWLGGDRQTAMRVAKARNPEQKGVV